MTNTQSRDRHVVYLDGYAGEGRYESGYSSKAPGEPAPAVVRRGDSLPSFAPQTSGEWA
jgi:hypothetical protein